MGHSLLKLLLLLFYVMEEAGVGGRRDSLRQYMLIPMSSHHRLLLLCQVIKHKFIRTATTKILQDFSFTDLHDVVSNPTRVHLDTVTVMVPGDF